MKNSTKCKKVEKAPAENAAAGIEQKPGAEMKDGDPKDSQLTDGEKSTLEVHENAIKLGIGGFIIVGKSLKAINAGGLYREEFKTFEDYCRERWGMSYQHAYRLIRAATCYILLETGSSPIGEEDLPKNESQVRPLLDLEEDKWKKAWQQVLTATKGKAITAEEVQETVDRLLGKTGNKKTAKGATAKKGTEQKTLEKIAKVVTDALKETSKPSVADLKNVLKQIQKMIGGKK